jgi:low affinity Fe/Cu permease
MKTPDGPSAFTRFATLTASATGKPAAFVLAALVILAWAVTGPLFHYSDTWQLVINTGTTVVTFLMVFLIQATQNRDSHAVHVKLDELIRATHGAHNSLLGLEDLSDAELDRMRRHYAELAHRAQGHLRRRRAKSSARSTGGTPKA